MLFFSGYDNVVFSLHVWGPGANNLLYRSWEMLYSTLTSVLFQIPFSYRLLQNTGSSYMQVFDDLFYTRQCACVNPKLLVYLPAFPLW